MNHVTREEILALLSVVPENTIFNLGAPPARAERTLSLFIHCQLSEKDAERVQDVALSIPCCQVPGAIGPRAPKAITEPTTAEPATPNHCEKL